MGLQLCVHVDQVCVCVCVYEGVDLGQVVWMGGEELEVWG